MTHQKISTLVLWACVVIFIGYQRASFAMETNTEQRLLLLEQQNQQLQSQVRKQQELIDSLNRQVADIRDANEKNKSDINDTASSSSEGSHFGLGNVHISGEGGIAFFKTGSDGFAPKGQFRVDEARLYVEAPVWNNVYFFGEADFETRENNNVNLKFGELYLDFEDVSQLWGREGQLNVRAGQMNIPFGEEYLERYAINNPLILHSVSDLWGFDPGVELYGALGKFSYVVAVQNGSGANGVQDFNNDKSVAGRISYDPAHWLHLSISGMRTGDVNPHNDFVSAIWFGGGFFRSLGSPATTAFHANLVQGDISVRWDTGHVGAFGGYARYDDNDPARDNGRDVFYYSVEAVQQLPAKFYLAARFSDILSGGGFPIVGNGNFGRYFFNELSVRVWRLSLGAGYRFSDRLIVKAEYAFEGGKGLGGDARDSENFFGTEAVFRF